MKKLTKEELKEILEKHALWLHEEEGGVRADLSGADLEGAALSRANLYGADLEGANLVRANLYRANLYRANLYGADLEGADLREANLVRTYLSRANLSRANLYRANLSGADLYGINLSRANLREAKLQNCIGNMKEVKSLQLDRWQVVYTADQMAIGCKQYRIAAWKEFTEDEIASMDGDALEWWRENREYILTTLEKYPAII